jgi:DNA-binding XRE family transcriptional regulator
MYYSIYAITFNFNCFILDLVNFRNEELLLRFGRHLKSLRKREKVTQEELSFRSEISLSQIARIETGKINPTLCTLVVISESLKIELNELLSFR